MNTWKLWARRCVCTLASCVLLALPVVSEATQKATVNWSPNVFAAGELTPASLVGVSGVSHDIAAALTERLRELDHAGKLPFTLNEQGTSDVDIQAITDEEGISLQPFAVLDTSLDSKVTVNGKTIYKSIVLSGLDVAVASWDSSTQEYRMLGMIPLNTYATIERATPFTLEEKAAKYAEITQKMIRSDLDFNTNKKLFQDLDLRSINTQEDTYQVADVAIGSKKAQEIFGGQSDKLLRIVASFFAGSYQQAAGKTVLPSALETGYYAKDVQANMEAFTLSSPLGTRTMTIPKAKHTFIVDVCGVNSGVMDEDKSDVKRHIVYRAWLRARPAEDAPGAASEKTIDKIAMEAQYKTDNVSQKNSPVNTYTAMYLDLSQDLGQVMAGKKLKKK